MKPYWPLCADVFTWWDKVRIAHFLFTERIWTYGEWIKRYEDKWSEYLGGTHAIMVSSGSTANELIALRRKWELQQAGEWPRRNKVVFPANTWVSSVSIWIHLGFEPVFVDVSGNLNMTLKQLLPALEADVDKRIGTVFYTALLGFHGDLSNMVMCCNNHGARFLMDNCEASFTRINETMSGPILNYATCSTSVFYSHFTTTGTEGGFIFTKNPDEADWFRMMRNHGMTRGMDAKYRNPDVHPAFDFYLLGSNYRSSNLQAFMGLLDFNRALKFSEDRRPDIFNAFDLDPLKYQVLNAHYGIVPLAIPILSRTKEQHEKVTIYLKQRGVETRPIIGGCLLAHTAFKSYGNINDYPVAKWAHESGLYIGLNQEITIDMATQLSFDLNQL